MVKVLRKTGAKKTPGNQHRVVLMKVGDGNKGGSGKNVETGASRPKGNDSTRREPKKKTRLHFTLSRLSFKARFAELINPLVHPPPSQNTVQLTIRRCQVLGCRVQRGVLLMRSQTRT